MHYLSPLEPAVVLCYFCLYAKPAKNIIIYAK